MNKKYNYSLLKQFVSGALHQDWDLEYSSVEDAFRDYSSGKFNSIMLDEINTLINESRSELELKKLMCEDFGAQFSFWNCMSDNKERTISDWLLLVKKQLEENKHLAQEDE